MTTSSVTPAIAFPGSSSPGNMGPFSLIKSGTSIASDDDTIHVLRYSTVTDMDPTVLVEDTDFTRSTDAITLTSPQTGLLTTERLFVFREGTVEQLLDLESGGSFSAEALEARLDEITKFVAEVSRKADTAVRLTPFSTDALPDNVPMEAAIDKVMYLTGTAGAPEYAFIENPDSLITNTAALVPYVEAIEDVAADLTGADTIGTVAADLAGDDDIGTVSASIADIIAAAAAIDDLAAKQNEDATLTAISGLTLSDGDTIEGTGTDTVRAIKRWRDSYAELQAITGMQSGDVAYVTYRSSAGDGGGGMFRFVSTDQSTNVTNDPGEGVWLAPDSDDTGASGAWKRIFSGAANLRWWGAAGDATTDDTTVIQNAFNWMEQAAQDETDTRTLFVPLGKYKLTSTITMTEGFLVLGEGCTMFRDRPFSTDLEEAGSWFYIAHTGKGFTLGGQGATSVRGGGAMRDVGTYRDQPTPGSSWAPTAHDYDVYIDDGNFDLENFSLLNPTKGIAIDDVSGRCNLKNIRGDAFDVLIDVLRASDVLRIDGVHCWPFWYDDNIDSVSYIREYKRANLNVIKAARIDNPSIENVFGIYTRCLVYFVETADGSPSRVQGANWGADSSTRLFEVDDSITSGMHLDLVNAYFFGYPALAGTQGIFVQGSDASINLSHIRLERIDRAGIRVDTGTGNYIRVSHLLVDDWNNGGSGYAAISNATSGNTIEVLGQPILTDGNSGPNYTTTGTVIIPHKHGYNASETSDGSGDIVITHGLGISPNVIMAEVYNNANIACRVYAKSSTTFTLRLYDADAGTALASTAVNIMWVAYY
jgi:hypothetical protein